MAADVARRCSRVTLGTASSRDAVLLPLEAGLFELLPWLGVIALQIVVAGAAWVTLGATLGRGARRLGHPDLVTRAGAVTLVAVTGLIWLQSFWSA